MSVTDQDVLTEIQLMLQEDATFSNGIWTLAEVLSYFNQRQYRFLFETKILAAWSTIGWVANTPQQPLPVDWIATISAAWHDFATNTWTPLAHTDYFEVDHVFTPDAAGGSNLPLGYREDDTTETLTVGLNPTPLGAGEMALIYVALTELLDGTGQLFDIPDDWVPYIKYGVYADMLGKEGRGKDGLRAKYCERRYMEGVVLAQSLLLGRP